MKKELVKIQYVPIHTVTVNPDNPRFIKDDAFKRLVKSLKDCPDLFEARPIICSDRTGVLVAIAGNMRLRAAKELKWKEVPVIVMSGLSEDQEREIVIKDNANAFGHFDFSILANEWDDLPLAEWGVEFARDLVDLGQGSDGPEDSGQGKDKKRKCPECGFEW